MVICLERGADLHTAQLMPLPLTVSCFTKIQTGFTFLVPAHLGSPGKRAIKRVCACVCYWAVSLLPEIVMILFTQSTAVLHNYLSDELKLLCWLQFFPNGCAEFPEFSCSDKILKYSRF